MAQAMQKRFWRVGLRNRSSMAMRFAATDGIAQRDEHMTLIDQAQTRTGANGRGMIHHIAAPTMAARVR